MSFKERLIETFGVNPFKCTKCNSDMILWEVWYHKYGIIYHALDRINYIDIVEDDDRNKTEAIAPLEEATMPKLICPNCREKFEYKKTDNR